MGVDRTHLLTYYADDTEEDTRLARSAHGRLEFLRTRELLRRHLRPPPARVLDIGGATGVHARWLAGDGYQVHLGDLVHLHVARARRIPGVTAAVADARELAHADSCVDGALLLGPLYHLGERAERLPALAEARRVVRPGGIVAAAAISRYLGVLEAGTQGRIDASMEAGLRRTLRDGTYDGALDFVPAHFHAADELAEELRAVGLRDVIVYGVEGPAWPALDATPVDLVEPLLDSALRCARLVETDPAVIATSAHLLAVASG